MYLLDTRAKIEDLIETFVRLSEDAEAHRLEERAAAVQIQSAWRRKLVRLQLRRWNGAATEIQRIYRGHLGRIQFLQKQVEVARELRMAYFNRKTARIQKVFRGYRSRKYVHSYYDRKRFIASSVDVGEVVKRELAYHDLEMRHEEQEVTTNAVKDAIRKFWLANHHLVSTISRKGLFYSPYIAAVKGINDIEDRILEVTRVKEERSRKVEGGCGGASRQQELAGRQRKSGWVVEVSQFLMTEGAFGPTAFERRLAEEKTAALLDVGKQRFRSVVRPDPNVWNVGRSLLLDTEWRRKQTLRALERRQRRLLFLRISPKPFFISAPKSRRLSCGPVPPLGS